MAEQVTKQVTKGILATFGVYESDIHDLERSADELESAYGKSQWRNEERAQLATMVRGHKARSRAALRAEEEGPEGAILEPMKETIDRLGAAFDLLMCWLGLAVRVHPEVKEDVEKLAKALRRDLKLRIEQGLDPRISPRLDEHMERTLNQAGLAGK